MLVTLGTNVAIGAGSSQTFTYSPNSLQKVFVRIQDPTGGNEKTAQITVQLGSKVICNGASSWAILGLTQLQSNVDTSTAEYNLVMDFGSHECASNDNVYVTIYCANALDAVDVSAIVDEPGLGTPLRITEYSDNTFTTNNALLGVSFDSAFADVDEDAYNCEVRTSLYSSAPSFISASSWYKACSLGNGKDDSFGLIFRNAVPLTTSVNYSASAVTDRIVTIEQDPITRQEARQGSDSEKLARMQAGR